MGEQEMSMQEVLRLARSPAGQQLIAMLQQSGGDRLQQAMAQAAAGDYEAAKQALSGLLNTPQAQRLLEQLGRP